MFAVPFAQLVHIAAMYTPVIGDVLELNPISLTEWLVLAAVSLLLLFTEEVHKFLIRRSQAAQRGAEAAPS